MTIDDMLAYRDTWSEKLTPEFDVESIIRDARTEKKTEPAKLQTTEAGYKKKNPNEIDEVERMVRSVQGVLNKLTEKNFDVLEKEVLVPEILNLGVVPLVVDRIFDKALDEPVFTALYAKLCHNIAAYERNRGDGPAQSQIRASILNKAQAVFEEMTHLEGTSEEEQTRVRRRKIANIRFVGELYNRRMLSLKVVTQVLNSLIFTEGTISEVNAEVALELLLVSGKELDSLTREKNVHTVWDQVRSMLSRDPLPFSKRLGFLYQNLIELRESGWIRKEDPLAAAAAQDMQQKKSPSPPPEEVPIARSAPAEPQLSEAEQKEALRQATLAQPPSTFDEEPAKLIILNKVRECWEEGSKGDWERLVKTDLATMSTGESEHVNRQGCLYVVSTALGRSSDESASKMLLSVLCKPAWDATDLSRGLAWCITGAIASRLTEDCPKFLHRIADCISAISIANPKLSFVVVVKDVFARAANYLDAIQGKWDYMTEWDCDYIRTWELFVGKVLADSKQSIPSIQNILDSVGSIRQSNFMRNIVPDFVGVMLANKLCSLDDLHQWCAKQATNAKVKQLVEELAMF